MPKPNLKRPSQSIVGMEPAKEVSVPMTGGALAPEALEGRAEARATDPHHETVTPSDAAHAVDGLNLGSGSGPSVQTKPPAKKKVPSRPESQAVEPPDLPEIKRWVSKRLAFKCFWMQSFSTA